MTTIERVLIAVAVVLIDVLLFALPLTGFLAAYVLLVRPTWFLAWVETLYHDDA